MKLKDIKVGITVVDKYSNEYIVKEVDRDDKIMPVMLECVKFVKSIPIRTVGNVNTGCKGESFYIYKSGKVARNEGYDIKCITVKSLKLKGK